MSIFMQGFNIVLISIFYISFIFALALVSDAALQGAVWKNVSGEIVDSDLQMITVDPRNPEVVYVNSSDALYMTLDAGKNWKEILSFRGTGNAINSIAVSPVEAGVIYAGSTEGLFMSKDYGVNWKRIFKKGIGVERSNISSASGIEDIEKAILSIAISPENKEVILIGTMAGIFYSDNSGNDWKKIQGIPSGTIVSSIAIGNSKTPVIYAATDRGLYRCVNGTDCERILKNGIPFEDKMGEDIISEDNAKSEIRMYADIRSIAIDLLDVKRIYLGTSRGVLATEDGGSTWNMIAKSGLLSSDIRHVVIDSVSQDIYAATDRGVFRYYHVSQNWEEISNGITSKDVRFLATTILKDKFSFLWAVTKNGVFKTTPVSHRNVESKYADTKDVLSFFAHEPTITEIQKAAIEYAEVHAEKIKNWRRAASRKAWLPTLHAGLSNSVADLWHWEGGSTTKEGDDILRKGRDAIEWDITLTWNLADLIWNEDQTSIDVRSRLMVQLREDVLNEVTRLYFERRKLQIEMLLSPAENIKDKLKKEMRLQELTANIDALTGFYLSKRLGLIK